jgi:hypothetical protein
MKRAKGIAEPAAYEWISRNKLRSADGRSVEIIETRPAIGRHRVHYFIREITATTIRDHHFPEMRALKDIQAEAIRIVTEREG